MTEAYARMWFSSSVEHSVETVAENILSTLQGCSATGGNLNSLTYKISPTDDGTEVVILAPVKEKK